MQVPNYVNLPVLLWTFEILYGMTSTGTGTSSAGAPVKDTEKIAPPTTQRIMHTSLSLLIQH